MANSLIGLDSLPAHMREPMRQYLLHGLEPGSFLTAVLANDLVGAYSRADSINAANMNRWASYLYNCLPARNMGLSPWGSYEAVRQWCERGGIEGRTNNKGNDCHENNN